MVAKIDTNPSISDTLNYNEKKVEKKVASLIHSSNYPKDTDRLGFSDKLNMLRKLASLNQQTKRNAVHIKIAFHPSERIEKEMLKQIADLYMQRIGFGDQPYLVYEHRDVNHPHIHIVTTNIKVNGKRIYMNNIGRDKSIPTCKEIEQIFGLVIAKGRGKENWDMQSVDVQKVIYGKMETKSVITNVINYVNKNYKFSSIPQLNVLLKPFNIYADQGGKDSRIYKNGGLVYRLLNEDGEKVGVPIKASMISSKPTLKNLSFNFIKNKTEREPFEQRVKNEIDLAFLQNSIFSMDGFIKALEKESIEVVLWKNEQEYIYGITFVDHLNKAVFNGRDLGITYSAKAIQDRINPIKDTFIRDRNNFGIEEKFENRNLQIPRSELLPYPQSPTTGFISDFLFELTRPPQDSDYMPYELTDKKKKKKKKRKY